MLSVFALGLLYPIHVSYPAYMKLVIFLPTTCLMVAFFRKIYKFCFGHIDQPQYTGVMMMDLHPMSRLKLVFRNISRTIVT